VQKLPFAKKKYRNYLPIMMLAVEQMDLSAYDLIISSSHAVAKGVLAGPDQLHICMCYSPIRYAWDMQHQYLEESGLTKGLKGWLAKYMLHKVRLWDVRTSNGVDEFIAISNYIARRIKKIYRRDSTVIYPPVDIEKFKNYVAKEDYFVTASRMVPYKRIDLIVEAFNEMPEKRLIVIGDGPEYKKIKAMAKQNVSILGFQSTESMIDYMQKAKAFIFAAEEDFGIAPIEAQACGTPVIAFGKGGALETIIGSGEHQTGLFFKKQTGADICDAVWALESKIGKIDPLDCANNAKRFSNENFRSIFVKFVNKKWLEFNERN
jgi:glycosyltransferase involved in cell wall biosynthesis